MTTKPRHIQQYRAVNEVKKYELDRQKLIKYQPKNITYSAKPKNDR